MANIEFIQCPRCAGNMPDDDKCRKKMPKGNKYCSLWCAERAKEDE